MATHSTADGQKVLFRYKQHFDLFNTTLSNKDSHGVADVLQKFLALNDEIIPLYKDEGYIKACKGRQLYNKDMMMLKQSLSTDTGSEIRLLQKVNNFLKPLAKRLYQGSIMYHPNSIDKC